MAVQHANHCTIASHNKLESCLLVLENYPLFDSILSIEQVCILRLLANFQPSGPKVLGGEFFLKAFINVF